MFKQYWLKNASDDFLDKDADMDAWSEILDKYIDLLTRPSEVWKRARENLIKLDISTKDILALENAFVRDILSDDADFGRLNKVSKSLSLSGIAKSIISGIIVNSVLAIVAL